MLQKLTNNEKFSDKKLSKKYGMKDNIIKYTYILKSQYKLHQVNNAKIL